MSCPSSMCSCSHKTYLPVQPNIELTVQNSPSKNASLNIQTTSSCQHPRQRRHSDPGPRTLELNKESNHFDYLENLDGGKVTNDSSRLNGTCLAEDEIEKDGVFQYLLQELRNLRMRNRKLCVELYQTKTLLQISEQHKNYSSEPGAASALIRKLLDAQNLKNDIHRSRTPGSFVSQNSDFRCGSGSNVYLDEQHSLRRECEGLLSKLRAAEKKIRDLQSVQGGDVHSPKLGGVEGVRSGYALPNRYWSTSVSPPYTTFPSIADTDSLFSLNEEEAGRLNWTTPWPRASGASRLNGPNSTDNGNYNSTFAHHPLAGVRHARAKETENVDYQAIEVLCAAGEDGLSSFL